ncbi:phosphotransferase family protein [Streptomyces jumonjinensis]|uniref:phosphotransferase family protein n=1 Tax=Streptomyces jumonjinensis TaxID=1945 RepID=UPI0037924FC9
MTEPLHGGYAESELTTVLEEACRTAGLDSTGARLLRGHTNAVVQLTTAPVVIKIARKGTAPTGVQRTVACVRWLMDQHFATVPLHPGIDQPAIIDDHPVTFWTHLPQTSTTPITAADLATPLAALHRLPKPPVPLREMDNLGAIHRSLTAIDTLDPGDLDFLTQHAHHLERRLETVDYTLPTGVIQGDPQHRNALRDREGRTVLCDWDTIAHGRPEWDLVTIEIHCRRFGHGRTHYADFAAGYGFDVTDWPGYPVLRDIRELRMITTNARKAHHTPGSLSEVQRRIKGLRQEEDDLAWNIL